MTEPPPTHGTPTHTCLAWLAILGIESIVFMYGELIRNEHTIIYVGKKYLKNQLEPLN